MESDGEEKDMNITVTIEQDNQAVNVIADEKRIISDVINELHLQGYVSSPSQPFMRSSVQERVISTYNTFRDESIYSGDKVSEIK